MRKPECFEGVRDVEQVWSLARRNRCHRGADFSGLNLNYSTFGSSNLSYANLSHSTFFRAGLVNANLTGANLTSAGFARAYLTDANLTDANLTGALLTATDLTGANLTGAIGADLSGAYLCNTTMPDGSISNRGCPYQSPSTVSTRRG